jgi:23S rRNA U2552 (ribose-2'-O)-methylase RlmE/FtsJ
LHKFVGGRVNILEIGIYSGGSLEMWRSYFGDESHIYGVDLEEVCKTYENEYTSVFIGDQADRAFWASFKNQVGGIDIVIDDGEHNPEQQKVTLEEMLPFLNPGGVYVCEDIHKRGNEFTAFFAQLIDELNTWKIISKDDYVAELTEFQKSIKSIHLYPYVLVIEKHETTTGLLRSQRHGTIWQPFLDAERENTTI